MNIYNLYISVRMEMLAILNDMHKLTFSDNKIHKFQTMEYHINKDKLSNISINNLEKIAMKEFNNLELRTGSIHIDPLYWTKYFVSQCLKSNSEMVVIQNGCCSLNNCPFNIYFQILEKIINSL